METLRFWIRYVFYLMNCYCNVKNMDSIITSVYKIKAYNRECDQ